jgi:hypothetical protein
MASPGDVHALRQELDATNKTIAISVRQRFIVS